MIRPRTCYASMILAAALIAAACSHEPPAPPAYAVEVVTCLEGDECFADRPEVYGGLEDCMAAAARIWIEQPRAETIACVNLNYHAEG